MTSRLNILSTEQFMKRKPMDWAIHELLPGKGLVIVYGPPASAKSLLTLSVSASLTEGNVWWNREIRKTLRFLTFVLEGASAYQSRMLAWEIHYGKKYPAHNIFVEHDFSLVNLDMVKKAAEDINSAGGTDAIIIDTLACAAMGVDENSPGGMGDILKGVKLLEKLTGALVILVHHSGKDISKGPRGHSSASAKADMIWAVTCDGTEGYFEIAKSKDGKTGMVCKFKIVEVDLGVDEYGDKYTSAVIEQLDCSQLCPEEKRQALGKNQLRVMEKFREAYEERSGYWINDKPVGIWRKHLIKYCIEDRVLDVADDRQTERVTAAINSLIASGRLVETEGVLFPA